MKQTVEKANAKIDSTQQGLKKLEFNPYYNNWTDKASKWKEETNMYEIMYNKVYKKFLELKAADGDKEAATRLAKPRLSPSITALPKAQQLPPPSNPRLTRVGGVKTRKKRRRKRKRRKNLTKNNKNKN